MISLENGELVFRFEEVHPHAVCKVNFQRTLRIPDDEKEYPLPPGLGRFEIQHIDDLAARLPQVLVRRGGVVMPMWQSEAMWLNFSSRHTRADYPFAIKISAGKINAITGEPWQEPLQREPQDYLVLPRQPWLDGFCEKKGIIRQFVAAALGQGATVEEQITGQAVNGGLQIVACPMKREVYEKLHQHINGDVARCLQPSPIHANSLDMGFAAGGKMRQELYTDPYGLDAWDQQHPSRCFITVLNAQSWQSITGTYPPTKPPTMADYAKSGMPWFDYYAADQKPLEGSSVLSRVKSFAKLVRPTTGKGEDLEMMSSSFKILSVGPNMRPVREPNQVREGLF